MPTGLFYTLSLLLSSEGFHTMEWYTSSILLSLLDPFCILLLCLVTAFIVMINVSQKRTRKLPPGPLGLPIIGHLHLLGKLPHQSLYELSKAHGPLMSLRFGSVPLVVASSPEMARQILQTHGLTFANRFSTAAINHIFGRDVDIAFSQPNANWKQMRRLIAEEIVSTKGIHFFKQVRVEERRALMRSVLEDACRPQQMRGKLKGTINNIMMRMVLGKRFSELGGKQDVQGSNKASNILELIDETFEVLGMFNVGDFLPWIAWMDLQGCERRSKRVAAQLRTAFESIINTRRLANIKDHGHPPNDYVDVLLHAQASASPDTPTIHIMEIILDLIIGATDTTTLSIEWVLADLLLNPEKMGIVQAEIDQVVGRVRVIEEEDIDHLPFLVACVKESMRLHPVGPLLVPHKNDQACEILGFHIPANTLAYVNTWAIGRDPKVWENPITFLPERFLKASTTVDVQGRHFELLPFGSGRRICPGWRLGLLTVQIILASLLQGFEWSIPPSQHIDMSECYHLNLCLANPLVACATPQLPKELY